ncbi:MAG: hypothetical protein M3Q97_02820 [Bacteroidota bacterium]|nr:hypothetical protein [Bacteroidota bacterium]
MQKIAFIFLFSTITISTAYGQLTQITSPADIWPNTYGIDCIQFGGGNKMFIGGRNSSNPILSGSYYTI